MKASELRIGNWIDEQGIENQVTDLTWRHGEFETNGTMLVECEPIPLTEDWLKRFGWEKSKESSYFWEDNNFTIWFDDYGLYIESYIGKLRIKHVHQLQNLYFALTGEEPNQTK